MCWRTSNKGQATVEAAFAIPVIFTLLLLLLQPGIVLYDRMVMKHAAALGCRTLATSTTSPSSSTQQCTALIKRQLSAVPPHNLFHIHTPSCSWDIQVSGSEVTEFVQVTITNRIKLLPLFSIAGSISGIADSGGCIEIQVTETAPTQPAWVVQADTGLNPQAWVEGREAGV